MIKNTDNRVSGLKAVLLMLAVGLPYFFSNFHRYSLSIIGIEIASSYGLTDGQLGLLGSAFFYTYAFMQIPCGIISDRISPKKMLVLSCVLAAASSVLFASSSTFSILVISRIMTGFATALVYVPAMSIIRNQFGDAVFGSMIGIMVALGKAGQVCSAAPLKLLNDWIGWRMTFVVIGAISIVIAIMAWIIIKENKRDGKSTMNLEEKKKRKQDMKALLSIGSIALMIWWFIQGGTRLSFQSLWAGKYFTEGLGVSAAQSSMYLTAMSVGCIFGSIVVGRLSDKIGCMKTLIFTTAVYIATWIGFALTTPETSAAVISLIGLMLGGTGAGLFTVGFAAIKTFVSKESNGIATGINNFFAFTGSAVFTQFCGSILLISKGNAAQRYQFMFWGFTIMLAASLTFVFVSNIKKFKDGI